MKNIKIYLALIFTLFIGFILGWFKLFGIVQSPETPSESVDEIIVDQEMSLNTEFELYFYYPDSINSYKTKASVNNVYDLLLEIAEENKIEVETQNYDFGIFIKSIDGYESSADMAWIYFVNGESGQVAADKYELKSGDIVEWKYLPPEVE